VIERTTAGSFAPRLEVAQQPLERLLIGVVVLPVRKIANVPRPPDVGGPRPVGLHHGLVQPDGKQDGVVGGLFVKGRLDLLSIQMSRGLTGQVNPA